MRWSWSGELPWVFGVFLFIPIHNEGLKVFLQPADKYNDPSRVVPQCYASD